MVHHLEPECHVKRLFCYLHGEGLTEGSYNLNMTISFLPYILIIADPFATSTRLSLLVHHHKLECPVKRLNIKVTAKIQNFIVNPMFSVPLLLMMMQHQTQFDLVFESLNLHCNVDLEHSNPIFPQENLKQS